MDWQWVAAMYGVVLVCMLAFGVGIGSAMGLLGILAITVAAGFSLWPTLGDIVWNSTNSFTLVAVPLFVLMGEIILRSGVSHRFYGGLSTLMFGVRGGLAQSNVVGCAIFAAVSGSSTATAMTVGTVAIPEMRKRGYSDKLSLGTLTGGGCLGILIPPSIPMVIYAAVVQESVIDMFMGGVLPGLLLVMMFMSWIAILVRVRPEWAPVRGIRPTTAEALRAAINCLPVVVLLLVILGGMYFGVVTPTEASALGCLGALALALIYREMSWRGLRSALRNAVITNAVVMFIIINSQVLSFAFATTGLGQQVAQSMVAANLSPLLFFSVLVAAFLVLGMFLDGISMMLLTVPLLYPSVQVMGFDGVWFGIVIVVLMELGQLTPPMGLNLFAIHSIAAPATMGTIARSSLPYALIIIALVFILYAFPQLVLWLPASLKG